MSMEEDQSFVAFNQLEFPLQHHPLPQCKHFSENLKVCSDPVRNFLLPPRAEEKAKVGENFHLWERKA